VRVPPGISTRCICSTRQAAKVTRMTFSSMSLRTPAARATPGAGVCCQAAEHAGAPLHSPGGPWPRDSESSRGQDRHRWMTAAMASAARQAAGRQDRGGRLRWRGNPAGARGGAGLARPEVTVLCRLGHGLGHYPMVLAQAAGSCEPFALEHGDGSVVQEGTRDFPTLNLFGVALDGAAAQPDYLA
jgi:hypothetical protein